MNRRTMLMLAALPLGGWLGQRWWSSSTSQPHHHGTPLHALLGDSDAALFERASSVRDFEFPSDHGSHPTFRHEWWYFTGNLQTKNARPFGFQLTFFRFALAPKPRAIDSHWRSQQLLLAHFAITDIQGQRFLADERQHRDALEIAGFSTSPTAVWVKDWKAVLSNEDRHNWDLTARTDGRQLRLNLVATKPPVLQGDRGLSRKGGADHASYYYSQPRLIATGTLAVANHEYRVTGTAWLDREWGTSALDATQTGWDWFGLQFTDQSELMFYRLRRRDGTADPNSAGTLIHPDGKTVALHHTDVLLRELDTWTSPQTRITYPQRWRLEIPSLRIELVITPRVAAQEWNGLVIYWEGAVEVTGQSGSGALEGVGYAELAGY
jgi:predicted secreted hydrolase